MCFEQKNISGQKNEYKQLVMNGWECFYPLFYPFSMALLGYSDVSNKAIAVAVAGVGAASSSLFRCF